MDDDNSDDSDNSLTEEEKLERYLELSAQCFEDQLDNVFDNSSYYSPRYSDESYESLTPSPSSESSETRTEGDSEDIKTMLDERSGIFLATTPPVIECILKNMYAKELNLCAQVCKMWNQVANSIKAKRNDIFGSLLVSEDIPGFSHHGYDVDEYSDVFVGDDEEMGDAFLSELSLAPSTPSLSFIFASERAIIIKPKKYFNITGWHRLRKNPRLTQFGGFKGVTMISTQLPAESSLVLCTGNSGIIGTSSVTKNPLEFQTNVGISSVFLPDYTPRVQYHCFQLNKIRRELPSKRRGGPESNRAMDIPHQKDAKCLLLFLQDMPKDKTAFSNALFEPYVKDGKPTIAVGGILSDNVFVQSGSKILDNAAEDYQGAGVIFSGPGVEAASIIIGQSIKNQQEVEDRLNELKAGIIIKKRSVAFLFACCARGETHYHKDHVETSSFKKVFPDVPLYGMFGNGEIGVDFLPKLCSASESIKPDNSSGNPKRRREAPAPGGKTSHWFYGYTSIFVILTWD